MIWARLVNNGNDEGIVGGVECGNSFGNMIFNPIPLFIFYRELKWEFK
jgi:hypothetical protein